MNAPSLSMQKISKRFPGVQALDQVDFDCLPGEIHALVGENGAGKSTLMKILAGVYRQDEGKILIADKETSFSSPREAQHQGVSIIYQEFNLIPELDVAENIFLGHEPKGRWGFIHSRILDQKAEELLTRLNLAIDLRKKAKNLTVAQQQMVEVAKAISMNAEIIIMDEPSAVVSGKELDALFRTIRFLKDNGKTIVYISHRMEEIFDLADRATVLKDGKLQGSFRIQDLDKESIIRMMVGRPLTEAYPPRKKGKRKEFLLLRGVFSGKALKNVNLSVYTGEILGVAGLGGSGRTELARAIFGVDPINRGKILLNGKPIVKATPKNSIREGIGFVTEDRKREGLVYNLPVRMNLTFPLLNKITERFFIRPKKEIALSNQCVQQFNISTPSIEQEVQYLSGGNQQKVILARWINTSPRLIIMDEPTRGIDVGAKTEVYNLMRTLAENDMGIIMISSELPEIIGMSDRIVVMHEGRIVGELPHSEATEERILMMATGG
jgi:ribose transport system ATP-binding protein